MAKRVTKTTRSFTEKGLYDINEGNMMGTKDGDITNIAEVLALLAQNGEELSISIKVEDSVDSLEE